MRKSAAIIALFAALFMGAGLFAQTQPDERLFQEAKILIFDKQWKEAQGKLEELRAKFPSSPWAGQAAFYRAECLNAQKGKEREALKAYQDYLESLDRNPSLLEKAEGAVIDLAFGLYEKGDRGIVRELEKRLDHSNKAVRYYAAYKLSFVGDKKIAAGSVPVLEEILKTEKDPELADRARIALLRVSPESLRNEEQRKPAGRQASVLKIRIWTKGEKNPELSLNIPWALADLTLSAILDSERETLRKKGYDIEKIMKTIVDSREILRIESDDGVIEIWIE
jgi:tetratricopeptide (TPR) repeat protein